MIQFIFPNKPVLIYSLDNVFKIADKENWVVQPKWNGCRALPYCSEHGEIIIFSRYGTPLTKTKHDWTWLSTLEFKRPWLLDGEFLSEGQIILWDVGIEDGKKLNQPYEKTLERLMDQLPKLRKKGDLSISSIKTLPIKKYKEILLTRSDPRLEGLVFKDLRAKNFWGGQKTFNVSTQIKYRFDK
jgi:hypothetical protein